MTKRPTRWCDRCESTVYADDIHSCFDAKAERAQRERERALTVAERAVVEAAEAWFRDLCDPVQGEYNVSAEDHLIACIRALRAAREASPRAL